jgi:DNA-binding NtrC family response regulator
VPLIQLVKEWRNCKNHLNNFFWRIRIQKIRNPFNRPDFLERLKGAFLCIEEIQMIKALLVSSSRNIFSNLDAVFAEKHVHTMSSESGSQALSIISKHQFDIIIADETLTDMSGLELAKKLISKNPMLNIVLVSALSSEDFHEASEGLGILMHLPPVPQKADAEKLLEHLNHILLLTKKEN